jgi:hypothetical protein
MTYLGEPAKRRSNEEEVLQRTVVAHLRLRAVSDCIWYAVPNGEKRSKTTGARLKMMGVVAGVADLAFVLPDGRAAFIEVKKAGGVQSKTQREFEKRCNGMGVPYLLSSNLDEILGTLEAWGILRRRA